MLVKQMRVKYGLSQEELASKVGVTRSTIAMIETEKNSLTIEMAKKLSKVFDIHWKDFFSD